MTQAVVSGILSGGLYAMMSLGMSLSWGVLKIINLAHFSFILFSGYITYQLAFSYGWDPFLAIVVCVPLFALVGMALQWLFDRVRVSEFESLLLTFGIFIIFESLISTVWTADFRRMDTVQNPYQSQSVWVGDVALPVPQLAAFVVAVVIAFGTRYLLDRTDFGRAVRALSQDRAVARAFGVDPHRVAMRLAGLAAAFAALAGVFIAMSRALFPGLAVEWFGIVFSVVILGGLGSTLGTLIAAVIIGLVGGVATVLGGPPMAPLAIFLVLIATLLFRPQGILGRSSA
ncbi:MAG TPA: branched-chain amino acid ABC transporter permease [Acidimicrobiia bacterium]|nr:branched-chain amino acid ABC transporter permease [Acidimicrobiia bacterium]